MQSGCLNLRCGPESKTRFNRLCWIVLSMACFRSDSFFRNFYVLGVIRYPTRDSPLEDSVYLASRDFIVDVMGCESATLTLRPCNRESGNLVEVFFSAGNDISSKIQ